MTTPPTQPVPPLPAGPLNAPIHGPRLPGHPGPGGQGGPAQRGFATPPAFRPTLPVTETDYTMFWRTPAWSWWRPIVAFLLVGGGWLIVTTVFFSIATIVDSTTGRIDMANYNPMNITPLGFIANNLGLAAMIGLTMIASVALFKQRPGFTASVVGRLRWRWLGRCFALLTPLWVVYVGAMTWWQISTEGPLQLAVNKDTWLMLFGILLTTPLQAAGEEFGFRGAFNRSAASFFTNPRIALVVGAIVSSLIFMGAHAADDPWLNIYYFAFGLVACVLTWRTGGLEAAIAMHVVNNVISLSTAPFSDISDMFNRDVGAGDPTVLIGVAVMAVATVLVVWQAKVKGIETTSAPGAEMAAAMARPTDQFAGQPLVGGQGQYGLAAVPPSSGDAQADLPAQAQQTSMARPDGVPAQPPPASQPAPPPLSNPRPWETGPTIDQR